MLSGSKKFNQDLSKWCVSNVTSDTNNFAYNSVLEEKNFPVWGTCPD
jgi:hypothetical protein